MPFCQRANPTVEQVLKTYGDKIRFVYRHYPRPIIPTRALGRSRRLRRGPEQFWPFHDRLFANTSKLSDDDLKAHAAAIGLDAGKFNACFDSANSRTPSARYRRGHRGGSDGTPAFFINGRSLEGAQPFDAFKRLIDEELASKKK